MNVKMTSQERDDYLHLWRYVGHLIGVDDVLGAMTSPERADACLESIVLHLADPDAQSGKMCTAMLKQVTPPPLVVTKLTNAIGILDPAFGIHMAISEHLLGQEFWELSELAPAAWIYRWTWEIILRLIKLELWIATNSCWWLQLRSLWIRRFLNSRIESEFGDKRTQYKLKAVPQDRNVFADGSESRACYDGRPKRFMWQTIRVVMIVMIFIVLQLPARNTATNVY